MAGIDLRGSNVPDIHDRVGLVRLWVAEDGLAEDINVKQQKRRHRDSPCSAAAGICFSLHINIGLCKIELLSKIDYNVG